MPASLCRAFARAQEYAVPVTIVTDSEYVHRGITARMQIKSQA